MTIHVEHRADPVLDGTLLIPAYASLGIEWTDVMETTVSPLEMTVRTVIRAEDGTKLNGFREQTFHVRWRRE